MKLGFSVFLHDSINKQDEIRIQQYANSGFSGIFTSLNLPEDDPATLTHNLAALGRCAKENNLELTVDISASAYKRLELDVYDPTPLISLGVNRLRIDDGIDMESIATLSNRLSIALNASTISEIDISRLLQNGADFKHLEAWHNYYPREATGLDLDWFDKKNRWLQAAGFSVMAFIPGNSILRGPVFATLPTLEKHRFASPFSAAVELTQLHVDDIYLGDPGLTYKTLTQFACLQKEQCILIRARLKSNAPKYLSEVFHQRADVARDCIRLTEGRQLATEKVEVANTTVRNAGAITLDNYLSGRYMGELEIIKKSLPPDRTVNVIGCVIEEDLALLQMIKPNQKLKIEKVSDE